MAYAISQKTRKPKSAWTRGRHIFHSRFLTSNLHHAHILHSNYPRIVYKFPLCKKYFFKVWPSFFVFGDRLTQVLASTLIFQIYFAQILAPPSFLNMFDGTGLNRIVMQLRTKLNHSFLESRPRGSGILDFWIFERFPSPLVEIPKMNEKSMCVMKDTPIRHFIHSLKII